MGGLLSFVALCVRVRPWALSVLLVGWAGWWVVGAFAGNKWEGPGTGFWWRDGHCQSPASFGPWPAVSLFFFFFVLPSAAAS